MGLSATTGKQVCIPGRFVPLGQFLHGDCEPPLFSSPPVTVQCTSDGQFVVVVARDATWPYTEVDSISLLETNDPSCAAVDFTSAFAIFQFPVTSCGTIMNEVSRVFKMAALCYKCLVCKMFQDCKGPLRLFLVLQENGYIIYENHMSSSYEVGIGPKGSITRDSHFEWVLNLNPFTTLSTGGFLTISCFSGYCSSVGILAQLSRLLSWRLTTFRHPCPSLLQDP